MLWSGRDCTIRMSTPAAKCIVAIVALNFCSQYLSGSQPARVAFLLSARSICVSGRPFVVQRTRPFPFASSVLTSRRATTNFPGMGTSLTVSVCLCCKVILRLLEHIDPVPVIPDAVHCLLFTQAGHEPLESSLNQPQWRSTIDFNSWPR